MARSPSDQLHRLFNFGSFGTLSDAQLLDRFVSGREKAAEVAFEELVIRHGPMVLRVCRSILRDSDDAEDAFQAVFLVLANRARSIREDGSVASWLFGVAHRVANRIRRSTARRRALDQLVAGRTTEGYLPAVDDPDWDILHEEIDGLPERLRAPIVLCYLQGLSYEAAAHQLGLSDVTIRGRLARARERLRRRLTRRGVTAPTGLFVAGAAEQAAAAIPRTLIHSTIRISLGFVAAGRAAILARGALRAMLLSQIKVAMLLLCLGIGGGYWAWHALASIDEQEQPSQAPASGTAEADSRVLKGEGGPGEIIARVADISRENRSEFSASMVAVDPETGKWRTIAKGLPPGPVSPDGRYIVYSQLGRDHDAADLGIRIYDTTGREPTRRVFEHNGVPHWSHDGRRVVIGVPIGAIGVPIGEQKFETWVVNNDGTGLARLPIPDTDLVFDCSRDGTWLATRTIGGEPAHRGRMRLIHPDGSGARTLTEGSAKDDVFTIFQISPDGKRIAFVEVRTEDDVRKSKLFVMDIEGGNRRAIPMTFDPGMTVSVCWSPDGSRLALNGMNGRTKEGSIAVVNLDGTNSRTLPMPAGSWNLHICDWKTLDPGLLVADLERVPAKDASKPRGRYQALLEEVKKAKPFDPRAYLGRFMELADSAPEDGAAVDAMIWVIQYGSVGPDVSRAIDRLAERHAGSLKVCRAALNLSGSASPSAEKLLRAVIEKDPIRPIKGEASLRLGQYWKHQAERVRSLRDDPEEAKRWEALFVEGGSDRIEFARFAERDPEALTKEAEAVLERTAEEFGGLPDGRFRTVGEAARAELDEIRNLRVGKQAPEIAGEDVAGQRFSLGDFRGKVVVLTFWADWCASCRDMYPYERALAERMRGKPFALLSVNGDGDRDKLRELIEREGLNWRSWWDGAGDANDVGPIARRYNVGAWPTIYVLDHRGVIRHKSLGFPGPKKLDSIIDALVKAAEDEAKAPKPDGPR